MNNIILFLIIIHIIGFIISIIIFKKNGTFKIAKEEGDGIRFAKPFDILIVNCCFWEVILFIYLYEILENFINNLNWD